MKILKKFLAYTFLSMFIAGCGLPGKWESVKFSPEVARDKFHFLCPSVTGQGFRKTVFTLHKDQTYTAETYYGTTLQLSQGTWERQDKKINIIDKQGNTYTYDYELKDWGGTLILEKQLEGTDIEIEFDRLPYKKE